MIVIEDVDETGVTRPKVAVLAVAIAAIEVEDSASPKTEAEAVATALGIAAANACPTDDVAAETNVVDDVDDAGATKPNAVALAAASAAFDPDAMTSPTAVPGAAAKALGIDAVNACPSVVGAAETSVFEDVEELGATNPSVTPFAFAADAGTADAPDRPNTTPDAAPVPTPTVRGAPRPIAVALELAVDAAAPDGSDCPSDAALAPLTGLVKTREAISCASIGRPPRC